MVGLSPINWVASQNGPSKKRAVLNGLLMDWVRSIDIFHVKKIKINK